MKIFGSRVHKGILFIFAFMMMMAGYGCKHEPLVSSEDIADTPGTPFIPCDPDSVYFDQQILPFIVSSCAKPGCHSEASAQDGVILNNYANVISTGDVQPFDLNGSDLWDVITETDPDKVMPPPGENPLTPDQISLIQQWILQGAQNLTCENLGPCDTVLVSFSADVQPIIQMKCLGCHTTPTPTNLQVSLADYNGVNAVASNGRMLGAIKHLPGYTPMPNGGPKLTDCEISIISNWISEGTLNN